MGAVYLGVRETLGQKVAVKVLAPELALVMEYVEGRTLEEVLAWRGARPPQEALSSFRKILPPVEFAHRQGVIRETRYDRLGNEVR